MMKIFINTIFIRKCAKKQWYPRAPHWTALFKNTRMKRWNNLIIEYLGLQILISCCFTDTTYFYNICSYHLESKNIIYFGMFRIFSSFLTLDIKRVTCKNSNLTTIISFPCFRNMFAAMTTVHFRVPETYNFLIEHCASFYWNTPNIT